MFFIMFKLLLCKLVCLPKMVILMDGLFFIRETIDQVEVEKHKGIFL